MEEANSHGYKKLYFTLFNRISDAVTALDQMDYSLARAILCTAQQEAEELYLEEDPDEGDIP